MWRGDAPTQTTLSQTLHQSSLMLHIWRVLDDAAAEQRVAHLCARKLGEAKNAGDPEECGDRENE